MTLISPDVHEELLNWGRYQHVGALPQPMPSDRAESAEGRYVNPSDLYAEREQPKAVIEVENARVIDDLYRFQFSTQERFVARAEYPQRFRYCRLNKGGKSVYSRTYAAQVHKIPIREWNEALMRIARMVGEALHGIEDD